MTLTEIADKCGTDKGSGLHLYTDYYGELFQKFRHERVSILEIGVLGGESIRMWAQYFDHLGARIYGVDIHDRNIVIDDPRVQILIGDGTNPNFIYDLAKVTGPLDIIVDDGSHFSAHQKDSLRLLWEHLALGGIYVCEDTHSSYHYPWTIPDEVSFVSSMMDWIHKLNENGAGHCGVPTETDILEIIFRKSVVVIKKR